MTDRETKGVTSLKIYTFMGSKSLPLRQATRFAVLPLVTALALAGGQAQAQEEASSTVAANNVRWYQFDVLAFRQASQSKEEEKLPKPTPHTLPLNSVTLYTEGQLTIPANLLPNPNLPAVIADIEAAPDAGFVQDNATMAVPEDFLSQPEASDQSQASLQPEPAAVELTDRKPDLLRDAFVKLPKSEFSLAKAERSMRWSRDYRVLWEGSWRMPLVRDGDPVSIRMVGGHTQGTSHELEGVLQLSLKRFLHAQTVLWVNELNPVRPLEQLLAGAPVLSKSTGPYNITDQFMLGPVQPQPVQWQWPTKLDYSASMPLHASKRLSFGKLIYIDNPEAGILIRVSPWERPEAEPEEAETLHVPADGTRSLSENSARILG